MVSFRCRIASETLGDLPPWAGPSAASPAQCSLLSVRFWMPAIRADAISGHSGRKRGSQCSWKHFHSHPYRDLQEYRAILETRDFRYVYKVHLALAGWISCLGCHPVHQKVLSLMPTQGTQLRWGFDPRSRGVWETTNGCSHINVSLSVTSSLSKINKHILGWRLI